MEENNGKANVLNKKENQKKKKKRKCLGGIFLKWVKMEVSLGFL